MAPAHSFRFAPILLSISFVILVVAASGRQALNGDRTPNVVIIGSDPISHPDQSHEFYRMKRAPVGQYAVPVERYFTANDQLNAAVATRARSFTPSSLGPWMQLGPGNIGGRTRALVIDPDHPNTMYAGGVAGGIWKSTDGGGSWIPKDTTPTSELLPNLAICSLAMDPSDPTHSVLYAGTGEGFFPIGTPGYSYVCTDGLCPPGNLVSSSKVSDCKKCQPGNTISP